MAIDRLWKRFGAGKPITRAFTDQITMMLYIDTIIQGATVAIAGLVALTVAALGLFALSAFTTERRTKEIGVRKAMGASLRRHPESCCCGSSPSRCCGPT